MKIKQLQNRNSINSKRGIPEGKEKVSECIFKAVRAENFPTLGKEMDIRIHEVQGIPNRLNPNWVLLRDTVIKLLKVKSHHKKKKKI